MTANAGYHAYATGDVLTAAQVQYNLQNQTVMYFATTSARTTALSAVQVEGMVTYIPANGLEYYNGTAWTTVSSPGDITDVLAGKGLTGGGTSGSVTLALGTTAKGDLVAGTGTTTAAALTVGTNGQTLVADSSASTGLAWSTPSAGGGMTLLSTTTLSGTNTTISSISGSYKRLVVFVSGISVSSNAYVEIQPNATTTSITVASVSSTPTNSNTISAQSFTNSTLYLDGDDVMKASNTDNAFCVTFDNYASASYYKPVASYGTFTNSSTLRQSTIRQGGFQSTTAITSLKFVTSAGTFGAGQVLVYGVN